MINRILILLTGWMLFFASVDGQSGHWPSRSDSFTRRMESLLQAGYLDSIQSICRRTLEISDDPGRQALAHYYCGEALHLQEASTEAEKHLSRSLQLFDQLQWPEGQAKVYNKLASMAFSGGRTDRAGRLYEQALVLADPTDLKELRLEILQNQSILYSRTGNHDRALQILKQAAAIAAKGKIASIYNQISTNYYSLGALDSAIYYSKKLLEMDAPRQEPSKRITHLSSLGGLLNEKGDYAEAQSYLMEALQLAENIQDTFFTMSLCTDISRVHASQKHWPMATRYARRSIHLAREKGIRLTEAQNLRHQGFILQQQDSVDQALRAYQEALTVYQELNHRINAADVTLEMGKLYQQKKDYSEARELVRQALEMRTGSENVLGTLNAKLVLGELELQQGKLGQAIPLLRECLRMSEAMDKRDTKRKVNRLLSEAYAAEGDYEQAYRNYRAYSALNDSILSNENARTINELEVLYETEKKDRLLLEHKAEIERQESQIRRRNYQLLLLAIVLILVGSTAAFLYFIYRKNQQLHQQRLAVMKQEQETRRLKAVMDGEEQERKRIAQDLHDGMGTLLAAAKMHMDALAHEMPPVGHNNTYQIAETLVDDACRSVREISHNMVPGAMEQHGMEHTIRELCNTTSSAHDIPIEFIPYGLDKHLTDTAKVTIYRIVQELLRNVVKHAEAREVIVQLTIEDNILNLIVEDDGKGFDPEKASNGNGLGLGNIKSRVAYLHGQLSIDSRKGEGSTFTVDIPLQSAFLNTNNQMV